MSWRFFFLVGFSRLLVTMLGFEAAIFLSGSTAAADDSATAIPNSSAPQIEFTVVESKRVREGNHTVIYNRVLPPQLPAPAPTTPAAPSAQDGKTVLQLHPAKKMVNLLVSATVFNHQISEISWTVNGVTYRGYSNIDFSILDGLTQFTSADTIYSLMLLVTVPAINPRTGAAPAVPSIPQLPALTPLQSDYVVVAENGQNPPEDTSMDDLHGFFDANRDGIAAFHVQHQADIAAQLQWAKDHPPVAHDTVINFWKK
jgi:hypothetical protein